MSFLTTDPEALIVAAGNLQTIGSALAAQNAAAAAPTTMLAPAGADEVSTLQAAQFAAYGTLYQQVSSQATAIQNLFVHTLRVSADSYGETEAANSAAAGAPSAGLAGAGLSGLTGGAAGSDPSAGLAGVLSNSAILAAMQGSNIGSATSEFTGLGKGYITAGSGVMSGSSSLVSKVLINQVTPAGPATPVAAAVSASAGGAPSVGALSVPPSWAGQTAPVSAAAPATSAGQGWVSSAAPHGGASTVPAGMPAMASAERGGFGFGRPRYGVKPTVMPRPTVV